MCTKHSLHQQLVHEQSHTTRELFTPNAFDTIIFAPKTHYTRNLLHKKRSQRKTFHIRNHAQYSKNTFTTETCYTRTLSDQNIYTETCTTNLFTPRTFYSIPEAFYTDNFISIYIYTHTNLSHQKPSTLIAPNSFCTETIVKNYLHQKAFAPEALHRISFRGQAVYTRIFCTQNRCTSNNNRQPLRETTRILLHKKPITPEAVCSTTSQLPTSDTHKRASGTCETCWKVGSCLLLTSHKKEKTPPPEAIISSHLFKVNFVLWGFVVMHLRSSKGWWLMSVFHPRILCCAFGKKNIPRLQAVFKPCMIPVFGD